MSCKISVIIPIFNAEKYLEECLESIVSSTVFNEIEVILVDDGSKDNSGRICDSFSQKYENIKVFHIENGGVSNARNVALANATGEYITFCDADDYYVNNILDVALQKLNENAADVLFFEYLNENRDGSYLRVAYPFEKNIVLSEDYRTVLFTYMLGETRFNSLWNKIFKREVIVKNSILFKKEQKRGGDRDFVIRFLAECKTFFYLPEDGYFYRYVETSIVNRPRTDHFDNIHIAYRFKVEMAPLFDVTSEELGKALDPATVKQIISGTFSSAEYDFANFSISMKSLFENEELMEIIRRTNEIKSDNPAYRVVRKVLMKRNVSACWIVVRLLRIANKVVRKFK